MERNRHHGTVCQTCRRRGRKCDKALPACGTCTAKGLTCEGYTLRWSGVASRGKLAGKSIPVADGQGESSKKKRKPLKQPVVGPAAAKAATANSKMMMKAAVPGAFSVPERTYSIFANFPKATTPEDEAIGMDDDMFAAAENESSILDAFAALDTTDDEAETMSVVKRRRKREYGKWATTVLSIPLRQSGKSPLVAMRSVVIPQELSFALNYHLTEVSPRLCVEHEVTENPYNQYIMSLAFNSPCLLYACAALASCHYRVRWKDESLLVQCLSFKGKAMRLLQKNLYNEESAKDPSNLAAILMLSLCDICLGGQYRHEAHFKGARRLIELRGAERTKDNFVEQYLAWLDIMSSTASTRWPLFSHADVNFLTQNTKSTPIDATIFHTPPRPMTPPHLREWSYDTFPCPIDQFEVLCEIVYLYKSQPNPDSPIPETLARVEEYKNAISKFPPHTERGAMWLHVTEAYRFAIILYLIRLFDLAHTEEVRDEVIWLAGQTYWHIQSTPEGTGYADQLLWPLFHTALEIKDEVRRQWIRVRSEWMMASGGFKNVRYAMDIVERVWADPREGEKKYMDLVDGVGEGHLIFV